ncbi:MAG: response regulator transcription factor, partial [Methylotenera sp.]|nr:response regulator transcription factor [Flavobacterium sp.]
MKYNSIIKNDSPIKILFLEDEEQDIELMQFELKKAGINFIYRHVITKKDFLEALVSFKPDIILADYMLPMFNGMHAFQLFREYKMHIPFILVTGSLNEELTLECLQEGIDDFVLKSSYKQLPAVFERNLKIKNLERETEKISEELRKNNEELEGLKSSAEKAKAYQILSKRELNILCLIASGKTIIDIANELFLSPATVATYRARLMEKLNLKS